MGPNVLSTNAIQKINKIHTLSKHINAGERPHIEILLSFIKKHAEEIESLYTNNNSHYITETGDLAVLCFEVLMDADADIDDVINKCFKRFENKLNKTF